MNTPYCPFCSAKTILLDHTPHIAIPDAQYVPVNGIIYCKNCRSKFDAKAWEKNKNIISC